MADRPRLTLKMNFPGINKSSENYVRLCQVLVTIGVDLFRDILSRYIKPADLRLEVDRNRAKLEKILTASQKKVLYSLERQTPLSFTDLDFYLLYILLRNLSSLSHSSGWGNVPKKGDNSIGACIERIRFHRNMLVAHINGQVEDKEFQYYWADIQEAVSEIEKELTGGNIYRRALENALSCDLTFTSAAENQEEIKRIIASHSGHTTKDSTKDEKEKEMETELLFDMVSRKLSTSTPFTMFFGELGHTYSERKTFLKETKDSECYFVAMYEWYQMYPDIDHKEKLITILSTLGRQDIIDSIDDLTKTEFQEFPIYNQNKIIDEHDMHLVCEHEIRYFRHLVRYLGLRQHELDAIEEDNKDDIKKKIFMSLKKITSQKCVTRTDLCSGIEYASQNRLFIKKLNEKWKSD